MIEPASGIPNASHKAPEVDTQKPVSAAEAAPPEPEEELAKSNLLGFILVPAMLVLAIVGIGWVFAYLTYNPYSVQDYSRLLRSANKSERWQAAHDMVETHRASADIVPTLLEMAHSTDEDRNIVPTTSWVNSDLLKTPEEKNVSLRWYAVAALGQVGGSEAFHALLEFLKDSDGGVRFYAAHGLGRIANPEATNPLIDVLKNDKDSVVRMVAAWSLGEITERTPGDAANSNIKPALLEAHQMDAEKDVRWNCAVALSRFGEQSVRPTLEEMLKADNPHTRDQARRALTLLAQSEKK